MHPKTTQEALADRPGSVDGASETGAHNVLDPGLFDVWILRRVSKAYRIIDASGTSVKGIHTTASSSSATLTTLSIIFCPLDALTSSKLTLPAQVINRLKTRLMVTRKQRDVMGRLLWPKDWGSERNNMVSVCKSERELLLYTEWDNLERSECFYRLH